MVPQRISLVTLGAKHGANLRKFYQALGWTESEFSSDQYAVFETAGVILTLYPLEELAKDAGIELGDEPQPRSFSGVTLAINVDRPEDVDAIIETVRKVGGVITREPSEAFWGGRTAYFLDPEQNVWEVAWNPSAVFDERGAMLSF